MQDPYSSTVLKRAISPVSVSDNTAQNSIIIDTRGYEGILFGILIGSVGDADATFATTINESNAVDSESAPTTLTTGTAVPAGNVTGSGAFQYDDDNEVRKVLVKPTKRWVQLTITPTGNSGTPSAALLAAFAQLVGAKYQPTTQPAA